MMPIRIFLLLLLLIIGCAKNGTQNDIESVVVPDVIDIGQVRANDSPIHTSFSIANHLPVPVEIDEILSGCGCTVIDLPQKIIRPGETIEVSVKIDLFGRKGDFSTDILLRSTSGQSWFVRINGKIIDDLWYAGQSIRLYISQNRGDISKDFTISTIDYPNVQFEFDVDDPDIRLSELSRDNKDGETRILFRLTVQNTEKFRTSSRIGLTPTNVDLPKLTIPVFYHHLSGEQKQWLATSQINLGEIKPNEDRAVRVYGDRNFLHNIHSIQAVSKDDVMAVVSHDVPTPDSDHLEIILVFSESYQELLRGSLTLLSHDNNAATVQVNGLVVQLRQESP